MHLSSTLLHPWDRQTDRKDKFLMVTLQNLHLFLLVCLHIYLICEPRARPQVSDPSELNWRSRWCKTSQLPAPPTPFWGGCLQMWVLLLLWDIICAIFGWLWEMRLLVLILRPAWSCYVTYRWIDWWFLVLSNIWGDQSDSGAGKQFVNRGCELWEEKEGVREKLRT